MNISKGKKIKCAECRYARPDANAPGNGYMWVYNRHDKTNRRVFWTGIECGNVESDYYLALLNIGINGERHETITWRGCRCGERMCESSDR